MSYKYKNINGKLIELTSEEIAELEARDKAWQDEKPNRDLLKIKELRLEKLIETDFWVLRGNMTEAQSEYRQKLRDIPADYDSSKYDELLERDENNNLTHTVWEKP